MASWRASSRPTAVCPCSAAHRTEATAPAVAFGSAPVAGAIRFWRRLGGLACFVLEHRPGVVELLADAGGRLAELRHGLAERSGDLRKPLRAEHDQSHGENHDQLRHADVEHRHRTLVESIERVRRCADGEFQGLPPRSAVAIETFLVKSKTAPVFSARFGVSRSRVAPPETPHEGRLPRLRAALRFDGLWWRKLAWLGCVYGPEWWRRGSPPVIAFIVFLLVGGIGGRDRESGARPRSRSAMARRARRLSHVREFARCFTEDHGILRAAAAPFPDRRAGTEPRGRGARAGSRA